MPRGMESPGFSRGEEVNGCILKLSTKQGLIGDRVLETRFSLTSTT